MKIVDAVRELKGALVVIPEDGSVPPELAWGDAASPAETDVFVSHPLYGAAGWVSVVNPAESTSAQALTLLYEAHQAARARASRGSGSS